MTKIGEQLRYPDAFYKKKDIGSYIVELIGGTKRGAELRIWHKETKEGAQELRSLPHIWTLDGDWYLMHTFEFLDYRAGKARYAHLKTAKNIMDAIAYDEYGTTDWQQIAKMEGF